jgi:hypothetical protein
LKDENFELIESDVKLFLCSLKIFGGAYTATVVSICSSELIFPKSLPYFGDYNTHFFPRFFLREKGVRILYQDRFFITFFQVNFIG